MNDGEPRGCLYRSAAFLLRSAGLVACAWFAAEYLARAFVDADTPWPIGVVLIFLLPSWVAFLWSWKAWERPRFFLLAGVAAAIIAALRFGAHHYEIDPDLGPAEAARIGFWSVAPPAVVTALIAAAAVWFVARRRRRLARRDPRIF